MKIPKLQTTWTTIPSDVTSSNWSVQLAQQQAALQRQRRFAQALARQRREDQIKRNQTVLTADNRTPAQRKHDRQQQQRSDLNNQVNRALSWYGLSNGLGQTSNVSDAGRATPGFGSYIGDQNIQTFAAGADPFNLAPYYSAAARFGNGTLRNWGLTNTLRSQLKNEIRVASELGKPLAAPTVAQPISDSRFMTSNQPSTYNHTWQFLEQPSYQYHPAEAVRRQYVSPTTERVSITTADPIMSGVQVSEKDIHNTLMNITTEFVYRFISAICELNGRKVAMTI